MAELVLGREYRHSGAVRALLGRYRDPYRNSILELLGECPRNVIVVSDL